MIEQERHYRRAEAAVYVTSTYGFPCSPKTLAKIACVSSDGPRFRKVGRFPLYPQSELDKWARDRIGPIVRSNAEAAMDPRVQAVMKSFMAKDHPAKSDGVTSVTVDLQAVFVSAMDDAAAELGLSRAAYIQVAVTAAMIKAGFVRVINDLGGGDLEVQFRERVTQ